MTAVAPRLPVSSRRRLSGLIPILATPFKHDGSLDLTSLRRLVDFEVQCGADGLATLGMASEAFTLTVRERTQILSAISDAAPDRFPIVAGINATSIHTAREMAADAVAEGAEALMVLPPYLVKPSAAQLVDFYGELGATSGADIMVQDAPGATGVSMPVSLIAQLCDLPGVTAVKVEAPPTAVKLGQVVESCAPETSVFGGQNALFVVEEYSRGAVGTMPACEFTDILKPVIDLATSGMHEDAMRAVNRLGSLIRFGMQGPIAWAVHKHVLVRRGVIATDVVRAPAACLDHTSRQQLDLVLDHIGLAAICG